MLKERLLRGGVEQNLGHAQFGFRRAHSTEDAMHVARRAIELANARRHGKLVLLALDWKMAFDSVNVEALLDALKRFSLGREILDMVRGMLCQRCFRVRECGSFSEAKPQNSGLSNGCTLGPILFLVLMSTLLSHAQALLPESARLARQNGILAELLYADDTLLYGIDKDHLEQYLAAIVTVGRRYGVELHTGKSQVLSVGCAPEIRTPVGDPITTSPKLNYLGGWLTAECGEGHELSNRIGVAKAEFDLLAKVWRHAGLSQRRSLKFTPPFWSPACYMDSALCASRWLKNAA